MKQQGWRCPYCKNRDRNLIETNNPHPWRKRNNEEETLLCIAIIPQGRQDSFSAVSDGTAQCGMQWDPEAEEE